MPKKPEDKPEEKKGPEWSTGKPRGEELPPSLPTVAEVQRAEREEQMRLFVFGLEKNLEELEFETALLQRTIAANLRRCKETAQRARQIARALASLLPVVVLVFALPARAAERPSCGETALFVGAETLIAADCWLTLDARAHGMTEGNPLLGERPSTGRVLGACIAAGAATAALWYFLPSPWRNIPTIFVAIVETDAVAENLLVGARFRF
jgi:hypothetical protein